MAGRGKGEKGRGRRGGGREGEKGGGEGEGGREGEKGREGAAQTQSDAMTHLQVDWSSGALRRTQTH